MHWPPQKPITISCFLCPQNVLDTAEYLELHKITRTYLFNLSRNKNGNHSGATVNGNDSINSNDSNVLDPSQQVKTEPTSIEDGEFDSAVTSAEKEKSADKSWPEVSLDSWTSDL